MVGWVQGDETGGGAWLEDGQDGEEWTGVNGRGCSGSQETGSDVGDEVRRCLG